ncbi:MAG: CHAT domain-containing protein [Gammaproteobacteria bacterium]|nr:CHAT domain-containing protein [Gammaproteobacteria bacterium]
MMIKPSFYRLYRQCILLVLSFFITTLLIAQDSNRPLEIPTSLNDIPVLNAGNKALLCGQKSKAKSLYKQVQSLANSDSQTPLIAELNSIQTLPESERLNALKNLYPKLMLLNEVKLKVRALLNLAHQAYINNSISLSFKALETLASHDLLVNQPQLAADRLDLLSQLYEDSGRHNEALALTDSALELLKKVKPMQAQNLRMSLHWRQGRLLKQLNQVDKSLLAYQKAVNALEAIRQELPIIDEQGRSSYKVTLEPLYMGLVELLLNRSKQQVMPIRNDYLNKVKEVIELTRQAEMQDFLGDRCAVDTIDDDSQRSLPNGSSILYIISLPNSTELLLQTAEAIIHYPVKVSQKELNEAAKQFATQARNLNPKHKIVSQKLYRWLLSPVISQLESSQTDTLIIVPSGNLRLVSFNALFNGEHYLIEDYAVSTTTGISMTAIGKNDKNQIKSLVAGLSEPGLVVDKLAIDNITGDFSANTSSDNLQRTLLLSKGKIRAINLAGLDSKAPAKENIKQRNRVNLQQALALPGVKKEVLNVNQTLHGTLLLNENFSLKHFSKQASQGGYRLIHIASHGLFGGDAKSSFILTHDELLTLNQLQLLLKSQQAGHRIDLLSLSACQTAEGNERAPLGISGAAMKARARSVLGTLWPVEDNAAQQFMEDFYNGYLNQGLSKVKAQQQAQIALLRNPKTEHPFFWAPFTLIGNWQ